VSRPSPVQNTPKADSMTPTPNFRMFSGTLAIGRPVDRDANGEDDQACRQRSESGRPKKAAAGAHGNDDEHDLESFQQNCIERGH
jgi:hypothetical protein